DLLGTLRYMPPEAFEGRHDARSDVYSLGLTLYELLVLRPAFDERDRNRLIKQVTTGEPPRPRRLHPQGPHDLETIVLKALDRDAQRRYQSAAEMAEDLRRFVGDQSIRARRASLPERIVRWTRHNRGVAALLGIIVLILLATAVGSSLAAIRFQS